MMNEIPQKWQQNISDYGDDFHTHTRMRCFLDQVSTHWTLASSTHARHIAVSRRFDVYGHMAFHMHIVLAHARGVLDARQLSACASFCKKQGDDSFIFDPNDHVKTRVIHAMKFLFLFICFFFIGMIHFIRFENMIFFSCLNFLLLLFFFL